MKHSDEDLKVIGRVYVEAVARERGADVSELVRSIATCVRATETPSRGLDDALLDALRGRQMIARDSPELLVRDLLGFVRYTIPNEDTEHFAERARKLGFDIA